MIGLGMSVPVGSTDAVKFGSRISLISLLYGFLQTFYILMRPTFSAPCSYRVRLVKTAGFAVSSVLATGNLLVGMTIWRDTCHEDVVQASAAALALFHGGLFWAYTRMSAVFLPFVTRPPPPPLHVAMGATK
jgi:hypothetical protein